MQDLPCHLLYSLTRQAHAAVDRGLDGAGAEGVYADPAGQQLRGEAAALSNALAQRGYSGNDAFAVVKAISDRTTNPRFTDYAGSAQAVMAVDTLLNAMVREGRISVGAAAGIRANINRAYSAVRSPQSYKPSQFRAALGQATREIGALRSWADVKANCGV